MLRALLVALLALGTTATARADRIDTLSKRLKNGNYKVRISAALSLARTPSARSVSALSRALLRDGEPTVRRVAAATLGKLLPKVDSRVRARALAALASASKRDRDSKVRKAAVAARSSFSPRSGPRRRGKMVVTVNAPSGRLPSGSSAKLHAAVERIVAKHAPGYVVERKSRRKKAAPNSFALASRVRKIKIVRRGSRAEVRCSVQVLVAPTDGRGRETLSAGKTATASGNGQIITSSSKRSIEEGSRKCVLSVVEQVTRRQVMPFLASAHR